MQTIITLIIITLIPLDQLYNLIEVDSLLLLSHSMELPHHNIFTTGIESHYVLTYISLARARTHASPHPAAMAECSQQHHHRHHSLMGNLWRIYINCIRLIIFCFIQCIRCSSSKILRTNETTWNKVQGLFVGNRRRISSNSVDKKLSLKIYQFHDWNGKEP